MINMTNVEYIDYFEKIIANEPENILSLYFVQKLMSDVRFRSFQPMISAELQKKILKMVLPKLKNQFKINRLVDFNPIGVADEEIEILNKESVTDVGTFVKTLDDGKVCKEIENLQIDKVSFYCLRVVYSKFIFTSTVPQANSISLCTISCLISFGKQSSPPDVKSWTTFFTNKFEKSQKNKPYKVFSRFRTDLSLVGLNCFLYMILS